jgi:hypothetical protein
VILSVILFFSLILPDVKKEKEEANDYLPGTIDWAVTRMPR